MNLRRTVTRPASSVRCCGLVAVLAVCGCRLGQGERAGADASADIEFGCSETLSAYLELCRDVAAEAKPDGAQRDDWMVGASVTTWEREAKYDVVYADAKYLSFRAEEYAYNGGAHGGRKITVGTLERTTGRRLKAVDLVPEHRRADTLAALYAGVVEKIGGEDQLQGEVTLTDNCFVAADGLHFVFNEYEVACYAAGPIEVVVRKQEGTPRVAH